MYAHTSYYLFETTNVKLGKKKKEELYPFIHAQVVHDLYQGLRHYCSMFTLHSPNISIGAGYNKCWIIASIIVIVIIIQALSHTVIDPC